MMVVRIHLKKSLSHSRYLCAFLSRGKKAFSIVEPDKLMDVESETSFLRIFLISFLSFISFQSLNYAL